MSPVGAEPLRTALYRVGLSDGAPELVIVLSNGDLQCGLPNWKDTSRQAEAAEALLAAACREGAQHLALFLYSGSPGWVGVYDGVNDAAAGALSADRPRVAKGAFYGIEEAFLVEVEGLERGYAASEDLWVPVLGASGEVVITGEGADFVEGYFDFPREGISGEFHAERCTGSTELVDNVASAPIQYCR